MRIKGTIGEIKAAHYLKSNGFELLKQNYYTRFGFSRHLANEIYLPDETSTNRLLAVELVKGSMTNLSGPLLRHTY